MEFNVKQFFRKCLRVWNVLRKPTKEEFVMVSKVSAIGILAIGFVGFVISTLMQLILSR